MPLLDVQNLHVNYGAIRAVRGVSLSVEPGEIVALIGANGAGKSTILRTISGLLRAKSGSIVFDGAPIQSTAPHEIVSRGLIHVPEGRGIFGNLTVAENLRLGAYSRTDDASLAADYDRVYQLFPRVKERLWQSAGTLSGGEQQMVAIGRALLARPKLLLLDEPSLGLAPQIVQTIFRVIRDVHATGATILLVEQNARMALKTAHRAYVLEVGEIQTSGPAEQLAQSDEIRRAYLGVHSSV